jgi:hypothetical protein
LFADVEVDGASDVDLTPRKDLASELGETLPWLELGEVDIGVAFGFGVISDFLPVVAPGRGSKSGLSLWYLPVNKKQA